MRASLDGGASKLHLARVVFNPPERLATEGPDFFAQKELLFAPEEFAICLHMGLAESGTEWTMAHH
jgi:hypothetical protein